MRLLVFGSRTFGDREFLFNTLNEFYDAVEVPPTVVIEGEAPGADTLGRLWAESHDIEVVKYPADWAQHGRAAGPIRNRQMLVDGKPDYGIGFIDKSLMTSRGTKNMHDQLVRAGIPVDIHWSAPLPETPRKITGL